jgi:hypothetical protein
MTRVIHLQSLEKDFYLGTIGSFDHDFTHMEIMCKTPKGPTIMVIKVDNSIKPSLGYHLPCGNSSKLLSHFALFCSSVIWYSYHWKLLITILFMMIK